MRLPFDAPSGKVLPWSSPARRLAAAARSPQRSATVLNLRVARAMTQDVPEPDWKVFREIREGALQRFCARVLEEVTGLCADAAQRPHERYQHVFRLLRERDRELAGAFDNLSRSRMYFHLAAMVSLGLLRDDELRRLSVATQERVRVITGVRDDEARE